MSPSLSQRASTWCCTLCESSFLRPYKAGTPDQPTAAPGFANMASFAPVFGAAAAGMHRRDLHRVPHGRLWHMHLAQRFAVEVADVERWCADPATMDKPRSLLLASATGVPLAELRPADFLPNPGQPA